MQWHRFAVTLARPWPDDIVTTPEVKAKVDSIWSRPGLDLPR